MRRGREERSREREERAEGVGLGSWLPRGLREVSVMGLMERA